MKVYQFALAGDLILVNTLSDCVEIEVLKIRELGKSKTQLEISKIFNTSRSLISMILNRRVHNDIV